MVRHHEAIHADLLRAHHVVRMQHALDQQLAREAAADEFQVRPGQPVPRAEGAFQVAREDRRAAPRIHVLEMRHAVVLQRLEPGAEGPGGMRRPLPEQPEGRLQRDGVAVAYVVLAVGGNLDVHREDEGLEPRRNHAVDQRFDARGLARQVGLVPGVGVGLGHVLHPDQRRRRQDVGNVLRARRLRQRDVAAIGQQRGRSHRRDAEGRVVVAPEQRRLGVPCPRIGQHTRHEAPFGEGATVVGQRPVGLDTAGQVAVQHLRQVPRRGLLEVMQRQEALQVRRHRRRGALLGQGLGGDGRAGLRGAFGGHGRNTRNCDCSR